MKLGDFRDDTAALADDTDLVWSDDFDEYDVWIHMFTEPGPDRPHWKLTLGEPQRPSELQDPEDVARDDAEADGNLSPGDMESTNSPGRTVQATYEGAAPMKKMFSAWRARRQARYDMAVLGCLLTGDIYSYQMWKRVGGSSGAIILALARLEARGKAWSDWAEQPDGSRRRRYGVTRATLEGRAWESR